MQTRRNEDVAGDKSWTGLVLVCLTALANLISLASLTKGLKGKRGRKENCVLPRQIADFYGPLSILCSGFSIDVCKCF